MSETFPIPQLGRLMSVDLREVWPSEPYSFTPWLAQPESLQFLAESLGLPGLELIRTEHQVDIFSADIVAKTADTGETVLIENQIERSDHTHLGQILTYAAGLDAAIIVWVVKRFTDAHRASLDWLNRITATEFAFFGVEVEALRIGESQPAPRFTVVSRPNDWSRQLRAASSRPDANPQALTLSEYWNGYESTAERVGAPTRPGHTPVRDTNYVVKIGSQGQAYLGVYRAASSRSVGAYVGLYGPASQRLFENLHEQRLEIEAAFGGALQWQVRKEGSNYWIASEPLAAPAEPADWPRQHEWLAQTVKRMSDVIAPLVLAALQTVQSDAPSADAAANA